VPTNDLDSENVAPELHLRFRTPSPTDGRALWELAAEVGLDLNSPYAYVLWGEYFAGTSLVATDADGAVGFVTGFHPPEDPGTSNNSSPRSAVGLLPVRGRRCSRCASAARRGNTPMG
jgi:hypothetical protein